MTFDQIKSTAIPILASIGTLGAAAGIVTPDQLASLKASFAEIGQGLSLLIHGSLGLVAVGTVVWTGFRTSKAALVARVQASPTEQVVTSDPAVKTAVPSVTKVPETAVEGQAISVPAPAKPA
jgi:hypothetical protein